MTVLYPSRYKDRLVTIEELRAEFEPGMHPAFARRLFPWIEAEGGLIGIGGGVRPFQPAKPGFAPAGKSFHLLQRFRSGIVAYAAVDLVARDGPDPGTDHDAVAWAQVPVQGSAKAARWGVHCNVGKPGDPYPKGESWHMQPVEFDGFDSWEAAGRPDPDPSYPIPGAAPPPRPPAPVPEEDVMVHVFIEPQDPRFEFAPGKRGVFTLDGHPVTGDVIEALRATGEAVQIVKQAPHEWWAEATLHRMGEQARRLYGDTPDG